MVWSRLGGMARTFIIELTRPVEEMLAYARGKAAQKGALFEGDATSGRYLGKKVEGSYRVEGDRIAFTITRKPALVPWSFVELKLRRILGGG